MNKPKTFKTIVIDPPWPTLQSGHLGANIHYDLMSLSDIAALPVGDLMAENAHLWLWVTNATIEKGYEIIRGWGFEPRSLLTWAKPRLGLGVYLRNATEHLIFATRGKAPVQFNRQATWSFMPVQDHSHKPEEVFAIIERVSPGPYLELFARRRPPSDNDWSVWGNQIESDISIPGYLVPSDATRQESTQ